jgi:protein tyrosine/serine phosphatase
MREVLAPMSADVSPDDRLIAYLENTVLSDRSLAPVFVHCHLGEDRTGLVIGLHRVFRENPAWSPAQAYNEMLQIGFHQTLTGLADYFFAKTNWHPARF